MYYVYELIDPRTNLPFYVGKGKGNRMYSHLQEAKLPRDKQINTIKCAVINNILACGKQVIFYKVAENVSEELAFHTEIMLIDNYGKRCNGTGILTNISDGGEGGNGNPKSIEQYSISGSFIRSYESLTEAADILHIHKSTICAALNGRTLLAGKFRWAYYGDILSPYVNNHISPVSQFKVSGEYVQDFDSIKQAAKHVKVHFTSIVDCISGRHHTAGGYRWAYYGEKPNNIPDNYIIPGVRNFACYDNDMNLVKIYNTLQEATEETGAVSSGIIDRCAGRVKYKSGGYYWKYYLE